MATAGNSGLGVDQDKVREFVATIEALMGGDEGGLLHLHMKHMEAAKGVHEQIKETYAAAKQAGIPVKALKAVIKARKLERKAQAARDDLEPNEMTNFDQIRHLLGDLADTPLGQAALSAAPSAAPLHVVA